MAKGAGRSENNWPCVYGLVEGLRLFTTRSHFEEYGANERTADIIEDYFSDRQQRVKVAGEYSSWNYTSEGLPKDQSSGL